MRENIKFPVFENRRVHRDSMFSHTWKRAPKLWITLDQYINACKSETFEHTSKNDLPLMFPQVQKDETLTGYFPIDVDFKDQEGNFAMILQRPDIKNIDNCVTVAFSSSKKGFHIILYFKEFTGEHIANYKYIYEDLIKYCGVDEEVRRVAIWPEDKKPNYLDLNSTSRGLHIVSDKEISHA